MIKDLKLNFIIKHTYDLVIVLLLQGRLCVTGGWRVGPPARQHSGTDQVMGQKEESGREPAEFEVPVAGRNDSLDMGVLIKSLRETSVLEATV